MTPAPWFVGIDVSKAQLDIAMRPEGRFVVPNDEPIGPRPDPQRRHFRHRRIQLEQPVPAEQEIYEVWISVDGTDVITDVWGELVQESAVFCH